MRGLSEERHNNIKRGDIILYHFGDSTQRAVVVQTYEGGYLEVRHKDFLILNRLLGYRDAIRTSEVLAVVRRKSRPAKRRTNN